MFRKKFIISCTIFVVAIAATMIWSSYVIKNKAEDGDLGPKIVNPNDPNAPKRVDYQSKENAEGVPNPSDIQVPGADTGAELDNSNITPVITERRKIAKTIDRNYVSQALTNQKLILWNKKSFPLKVYIMGEERLPGGYSDGIKTGFSNWQNTSNQFFTFTYVASPANADIVIDVVDNGAGCINGETGKNTFMINGSKLYQVNLEIPKTSCSNKPVPATDVYIITQHHLGHILGIAGHSTRSADVMHEKPSYENINISSIDVATLKLLYQFAPEITNIPYSQAEVKNMLQVSEVRGKSKAAVEKYLAENLIDNSAPPDQLETAISNANTYYKGKNYPQAMKWYNQALILAKDSQSLSYVYYSIAVINLETGNTKDALDNANRAYEEASTPVNAYLIAYINFQNGEEQKACEQLEYIIQNYPKIRNAYSILGQIYLNRKDTEKLKDLTRKAEQNFPNNSPIKLKE